VAEAPAAQGEVVFHEAFLEWVMDMPTAAARTEAMGWAVSLLGNPDGTHPIGSEGPNAMPGWNTSRKGDERVVFRSRVGKSSVTSIEMLIGGPRDGNAVYAAGRHLLDNHFPTLNQKDLLSNAEVYDLGEALELIEMSAADIGVDWVDFYSGPPDRGMVTAAVKSGALDRDTAESLSASELQDYVENYWTTQDRDLTLQGTLGVGDADDVALVVKARQAPRCGQFMPVAKAACLRAVGHRGPCRRAPD
jgi:hypothetical protein